MKDTYEKYLNYIRFHPDATYDDIQRALGLSRQTIYRHKRKVKEQGDYLHHVGIYALPPTILHKKLPPPEYKYVHLAAYLAKFNNEDIVPPWNLTKGEIMFAIRKQLNTRVELAIDLVYGTQDKLALYALYQGEVAGFKDCIGTLTVPTNYL